MKPNDIEELLQQYGADQRQQQQAADHVRHLAHRQAQRRTAAACVAVLVAIVGVMMHRWQQLPEPIGTLVAEQPTIITPHTPTMPPSIEPTATLHPAYTQQRKSERSEWSETSEKSEYSEKSEKSDFSDSSDPSDFSDLSDPSAPLDQTSPHPIEPSRPHLPELPSSNYSLSPAPETTPKASRLHFTASIGASTAANAPLGVYDNLLGIGGISLATNYPTITPTQNLSANVGVAYTVASNHRSHFDVGVALSGYTGHYDIQIHEFGYTYANAFESSGQWTQSGSDGTTPIPNSTTEHYTYNTFSLFAGVPLTLNLHPRGTDRLGWQFSLTPAHNLVTTHQIGSLSATRLNPWKLTVGIGVALPNSFIRHISFTANLLPLYTSQSLHEFGIELGI